jgi:hypothetical protein
LYARGITHDKRQTLARQVTNFVTAAPEKVSFARFVVLEVTKMDTIGAGTAIAQ